MRRWARAIAHRNKDTKQVERWPDDSLHVEAEFLKVQQLFQIVAVSDS